MIIAWREFRRLHWGVHRQPKLPNSDHCTAGFSLAASRCHCAFFIDWVDVIVCEFCVHPVHP
jgi:hypothetical protein